MNKKHFKRFGIRAWCGKLDTPENMELDDFLLANNRCKSCERNLLKAGYNLIALKLKAKIRRGTQNNSF